jgi:hypothetical protein
MLAAVRSQVDAGDGALVHGEHGRLDGGRVAGEREDGSVVGRVRRIVKQAGAADAANRLRDGLDDVRPAPLAHVGNAFDDLRHGARVSRFGVRQLTRRLV